MTRRFKHRWPNDTAFVGMLALLACIYIQIYKPYGVDEGYYLGQLSSMVEDGDLDLRNDFLWMVNGVGMTTGLLTKIQPNGKLDNVFSIGPALHWTPAYAAGRAWVRAGLTDDLRRWGHPHVTALQFLSLVALTAACWVTMRVLRRLGVSSGLSLLGTTSLLVGSPLFFYGFSNYGGSHLASAFTTSLYVGTLFQLLRNPTPLRGLLSGLALGLLCLVRWQDALYGMMAPILILASPSGRSPRIFFTTCAAFAAGVLAFVSLQAHVWFIERGTFLTIPQGGGFMHWTEPRIAEFLFAGYRGLIPWAPIYALGFLGLVLPWRCKISPAFQWGALLVLLAEVYVNACVWDWWAGASYGQRRMVSCLPLVAIGLANLLRIVPRPFAIAGLTLLIVWGVVTVHLHQSLAQDLTLLVTGEPSSTSAERDQIHQNTAEHARQMLARWNPGFSEANLFEYDFIGGSAGGRIVTLILAALVIAATVAAFRIARSRLLIGTLATYFALVLILHLRLALAPPIPDSEYARWRDLSLAVKEHRSEEVIRRIQEINPSGVYPSGAGSPYDAYLYLAFAEFSAQRNSGAARQVFTVLKSREYQSLELVLLE